MPAALTNGHGDKHTGMQGCPGIGIGYTTHKKWSEFKNHPERCDRKTILKKIKNKIQFSPIFKSLGFRDPPSLAAFF